jgi:CubicO group peptidase (beta-lactamase class C family)
MLRTFVLLTLLISTCAFGQVPVPDTPAGKAFSALLAAFNSADRQQIAAFDTAYQQTRIPVQSTLALRDRTGGFTLLRIEKSEPYTLEALLKENDSDTAVRMKLGLSADEKHPVLQGVEFMPVSMPAELRPARLDQAAALAALRARIGQMAAQDMFSGRVLVARHGKILLDESRGLAEREAKIPVDADTRFRIGSMNKMFTAIAILQLAEAGKLRLSDPLAKFLPDYPNKEMAAKVTIRHLLSHTGGTGDIFGPDYDSYRLALRSHDDYIAQFGARAALFEPGARFQYSNYGFVLLGAVIERASGMSYYDYVDTKIYRPAGMTSTGSLPEDVAVPGRSQGYMRRDGAWQRNTGTLPYRGMAAGGGYSTGRDLLAFAGALAAGKLVSPASLAEATEPSGSGEGYGLGFLHDGEGLTRMYGHNGGAPGMTAALWIYPKAGYVLVGLSNLDQNAATRPLMFFNRRMPLE